MYNIIEIYWEIFGRNDLQRAHCSIYFSQLWWYKNVPILSPSSHRLHLNHQEPSGLVTRHLTRKIKEQFVLNLKSNPGLSANSFQTSKILVQKYVSTVLHGNNVSTILKKIYVLQILYNFCCSTQLQVPYNPFCFLILWRLLL